MKCLVSLSLLITLLVVGSNAQPLPDGVWHGDLFLNDSVNLGFVFHSNNGRITVQNAEEKILLNEAVMYGDSFSMRFPDYDSELRFVTAGPMLSGEFINHAKTSSNVFSFRGIKDIDFRYSKIGRAHV